MIIQMTRTTSPESTAARRVAVAGVVSELNGAIRLLRCAATGRMVKQGVSMTHLHVMWRLEESGELAMSRLAEFLDVSLSNATGLIDRMEERGLVERSRESDDRRVVLVRLTAAGEGFLHEIQIMKDDLLSAVLARLDDGQLDRLNRPASTSAPRSVRRRSPTRTDSWRTIPTPTSSDPSRSPDRGPRPSKGVRTAMMEGGIQRAGLRPDIGRRTRLSGCPTGRRWRSSSPSCSGCSWARSIRRSSVRRSRPS